MAKPPKRKMKYVEIELVADAWPRFKQFIRDVAKAGPQHRPSKSKMRPVSKGRVRKGKSHA